MRKTFIALIILLSVTIGAIAGYQYGKMRWQSYMRFWISSIVDSSLNMEDRSAGMAYFSASPQIAAWALEHTLYTYGHFKPYLENDLRNDPKSMAVRTAVSHGRLAVVYQSIGDTNRYREHMDQAMNSLDGSTEKYILKIVDILDRKLKEELGQQAGPAYPPQGVGSADP